MAGNPSGNPGPQLRWPVVLGVAGVFGVVAGIVGSGAQSARVPDEIPPDLEVTTSLALPDTTHASVPSTVPESWGTGRREPEPQPIRRGRSA